MTDKMNAAILVLDFDGVLHSYTSGWQGADVINDPPVKGAQQFCKSALEHFEIHIVSSRCSQPGGAMAIMGWLRKWDFPTNINVSIDGSKPPAYLTIDDRAITFTGKWPSIQWLNNFVPWYRREEGNGEKIKGNLKDATFEALNKKLIEEVEQLRTELAGVKAKSEERKVAIRIMLDFLYGEYDDIDGTATSETRMNDAARKALED